MGGIVLGREEVLDTLGRLAFDGETVLVYGPMGIGKTTVLNALARRTEESGRPCAFCPDTARLADITEALVRGYSIDTGALTQRRRRSRVRLAVEHRPGILLLDHLLDVGTAVKGYLRSLRGTGLGVVIAADVEHPRDHARIRTRGLSYREIALPPLPERYMRRLLDRQIKARQLPNPVSEPDRSALVQVAQGRPGRVVRLVAAVSQPRYWRGDRLLIDLLATDISIAVTQQYGVRLSECRMKR